jgi:hypothetical protein
MHFTPCSCACQRLTLRVTRWAFKIRHGSWGPKLWRQPCKDLLKSFGPLGVAEDEYTHLYSLNGIPSVWAVSLDVVDTATFEAVLWLLITLPIMESYAIRTRSRHLFRLSSQSVHRKCAQAKFTWTCLSRRILVNLYLYRMVIEFELLQKISTLTSSGNCVSREKERVNCDN